MNGSQKRTVVRKQIRKRGEKEEILRAIQQLSETKQKWREKINVGKDEIRLYLENMQCNRCCDWACAWIQWNGLAEQIPRPAWWDGVTNLLSSLPKPEMIWTDPNSNPQAVNQSSSEIQEQKTTTTVSQTTTTKITTTTTSTEGESRKKKRKRRRKNKDKWDWFRSLRYSEDETFILDSPVLDNSPLITIMQPILNDSIYNESDNHCFCQTSSAPKFCLEEIIRLWTALQRWLQSTAVRKNDQAEMRSLHESLTRLKEQRDKFEELEQGRIAREEAGEEEESEENEKERTQLFGSISEESVSLFCCAYELCQKVLQRQQAQWQREWEGIEQLADLPGARRRLEREWECMNYWCQCENEETHKEEKIRCQMDELVSDQNTALKEGRESDAQKLEDAFWDLDWHLYEMQWERIDWRISVLEEQLAMLTEMLNSEQTDSVIEDLQLGTAAFKADPQELEDIVNKKVVAAESACRAGLDCGLNVIKQIVANLLCFRVSDLQRYVDSERLQLELLQQELEEEEEEAKKKQQKNKKGKGKNKKNKKNKGKKQNINSSSDDKPKENTPTNTPSSNTSASVATVKVTTAATAAFSSTSSSTSVTDSETPITKTTKE
eukprot:TRINITY_DN41_c2_g6_i1.p1 TRINITY_DN41_c2_g6~~TRINITY_DN41_c2_g6_i1.p1  ORF type:complete len:608 (-),score=197.06 TRINITY_DN41_c2_g6_i1:1547-3370(-)